MTFVTYPDAKEIVKGSGLLYLNPTGISKEADYGTLLGYTEDGCIAYPGYRTIELTTEETGQYPTLAIFVGAQIRLLANLLNWNRYALSILFPYVVGGTSNKAVSFPGSLKTGKDVFNMGSVLYVPEDTTNHPAVYCKTISPHLIETAKISFIHSKDTVFPFGCTGKSMQIAPLSEIAV